MPKRYFENYHFFKNRKISEKDHLEFKEAEPESRPAMMKIGSLDGSRKMHSKYFSHLLFIFFSPRNPCKVGKEHYLPRSFSEMKQNRNYGES